MKNFSQPAGNFIPPLFEICFALSLGGRGARFLAIRTVSSGDLFPPEIPESILANEACFS